MKVIKARIPQGHTALIQEVELFTIEEAKKILSGKDWDIGVDIYSIDRTNERIGWLAAFADGDGIYVEAK